MNGWISKKKKVDVSSTQTHDEEEKKVSDDEIQEEDVLEEINDDGETESGAERYLHSFSESCNYIVYDVSSADTIFSSGSRSESKSGFQGVRKIYLLVPARTDGGSNINNSDVNGPGSSKTQFITLPKTG